MHTGVQGLGSVYLDGNGYERSKESNRLVHREVCRIAHGSFLPSWHVHHVNGRKRDNDASNLIALPAALHENVHRYFTIKTLPSREFLLSLLSLWVSNRQAAIDRLHQSATKQSYKQSRKRRKRRGKKRKRVSKGERKAVFQMVQRGEPAPTWFSETEDGKRLLAIWSDQISRGKLVQIKREETTALKRKSKELRPVGMVIVRRKQR